VGPRTVLKLYVVSGTQSSDRAVAALDRLRSEHLGEDADVEVIDLRERPETAEAERIVATPLLVREEPAPRRRIVGDLSDSEKLRWSLGLA
jgi:circadian clock protein KaiB